MRSLKPRSALLFLLFIGVVVILYMAFYTTVVTQASHSLDAEIYSRKTSELAQDVTGYDGEFTTPTLSNEQPTVNDDDYDDKREIIHSPRSLRQAGASARFENNKDKNPKNLTVSDAVSDDTRETSHSLHSVRRARVVARFDDNEDENSILSSQKQTVAHNVYEDRREAIHSPHSLNETEVAARFERRREILRSACRSYNNSATFNPIRRKNVVLPMYKPAMNVSVSYCPIEKVSSTTWRGIFHGIEKEMQARHIRGTFVNGPSRDESVSFTFVREPYGRLLSAYVDKLYSPNTLFWGMTGRYIVQHFRRNASPVSLSCGHDVTFPEFVKFFIHMQHTGRKRDGHFIPIHDHCQMCHRPYKYIGHLETLKEDMPFILKAIQSPVTYNKSFDNVTIEDNIKMVLKAMRSGVQRCTDLDEACRRLWKKWQIRGIIGKTRLFPVTREQTRNISVEEFSAAALATLGRSGEKTSRLRQKKEALREAYASVPLGDRLEVKKLLFLDFKLFGFDPEPEEVFPTSTDSHDDFSYFDLYK